MYKHLYDIFKHWYNNQGQVYFYSDPHFSDEDCYRLRFPKEFDLDNCKDVSEETKKTANKVTIQHLDQMQIDNINKICNKRDTLVILGDVGNVDCVRKLKAGYKVLIMGNHDSGAVNYKRGIGYIDREHKGEDGKYHLVNEDNRLFDEVYEGTLQISPKIMLSHEPYDFKFGLNIHGHVHVVNPVGAYTEHLHLDGCYETCSYNCCAEQINYKPICLKHLIEAGIISNVVDIHRQTINEATKRKKKRGC